jgi:hypothetical protein
MEQKTLPKNKLELKEFILQTVNEGFIPFISNDEQEELNRLYGESLSKLINNEDFELL